MNTSNYAAILEPASNYPLLCSYCENGEMIKVQFQTRDEHQFWLNQYRLERKHDPSTGYVDFADTDEVFGQPEEMEEVPEGYSDVPGDIPQNVQMTVEDFNDVVVDNTVLVSAPKEVEDEPMIDDTTITDDVFGDIYEEEEEEALEELGFDTEEDEE